MTRRAFLAGLFMLAAQLALADTTTARFGFIQPTVGSYSWGPKINGDWAIADSSVAALYAANTFVSSNTFLAPILMNGTSVQLTGPNGYVTAASSITTTAGLFGATVQVATGTFIQNGATPGSFSSAPLQIYGITNGDIQQVIQNQSSGNSATSGTSWTANDGTNSSNFGACSINGSGYSGSANSWFDGPHDFVCYSQGGNASFGAQTVGGHISLFAGGSVSTNVVVAIFSTGTYTVGGEIVTSTGVFGATTSSPPPVSLVLFSSGTNGGVLFNPMTTTQKNLLPTPTLSSGTMVFDLTLDQYSFWNGTAWSAIGGGGGSISIATGPTTGVGYTQLPAETTVYFDSTFVTAVDSPTIKATILSFKNMGGITSAPKRTVLTSGSGTYTPSNGASMLRVHMCGGGGGGGGVGGTQTTPGNNGGVSSFASVTSSGGVAGQDNIGTTSTVGTAGGTGGTGGTDAYRAQGMAGGMGTSLNSGNGGGSAFFGGGAASLSLITGTGNAGQANTGGGASGGCWATSRCGSGGSGAECVDFVVTSPVAASYAVGAGGAGSVCSIASGGAGGSGLIIIDEYYGTQGFAAPSLSTGIITTDITTTATTPGACVTGSTRTVVTTGSEPVEIKFSGLVRNQSVSDIVRVHVLRDGALFGGQTNTQPFSKNLQNNAGAGFVWSATFDQFDYPGAGTHSYCLALDVDAGTGEISGSQTVAAFTAVEVKNTVGTGDVSSNGANTLSGPLTVAGTSNVETFLSSQTFSASSAFTVGLTATSSSTVHCVVNAIQNTSNGYPQITFNSDTTAGHYSYVGVGESIGGVINSGANSSSNIPPLNLVQIPTAGSHYHFNIEFNSSFTDETQVYGGGFQLNGNWAVNTYGGRWTSGPPKTMTVTPSAGTITGYAQCFKMTF